MSWHDELTWADATNQLRKKASFRGAYFFVRDTSTSFGRRNIVHQYPQKDEPYIEDIGRDTDEFSIEGYVVQNVDNSQNYFTERNLLMDALREEGPGQLWHPFLGVVTVSLVGKARMTESFREGGLARFSMTFVRAEQTTVPFPSRVVDHQKAVDSAYDSAIEDTTDGFGQTYNPDDQPGFALQSISNSVDGLNTMMRSAMLAIQGLGTAQMSKALTYLADEYADIDLPAISQTCSFANSIIGMFNGLLSLSGIYGDIIIDQLFGPCSAAVRGISAGPFSGAKVELPETGFMASTTAAPAKIDETLGKFLVTACLAMAEYGKSPDDSDPSVYGGSIADITVTSVTTAQLKANQIALINLIRNTAIATAAKIAVRIDYSSYDSAFEVLGQIIDALDAQLLKIGNDTVNSDLATYGISAADSFAYNALESLRPVITDAMTAAGAGLAGIISYTVPSMTLSTLALAYDKYEDLDREQEVIGMNATLISHPGFLPGGVDLEILNE